MIDFVQKTMKNSKERHVGRGPPLWVQFEVKYLSSGKTQTVGNSPKGVFMVFAKKNGGEKKNIKGATTRAQGYSSL